MLLHIFPNFRDLFIELVNEKWHGSEVSEYPFLHLKRCGAPRRTRAYPALKAAVTAGLDRRLIGHRQGAKWKLRKV